MKINFLSDDKRRFINNYSSLISKIGQIQTDTIYSAIRFCTLFQSADIELYNKFKNSEQKPKDIINIYAEMFGLNPQKDIREITHRFAKNAIGEGICYHINNSANAETILNLGLGISAIGLKTDARKDFETLEELVEEDQMRLLHTFANDKKGSRVYYSTIPIPNARYGSRPEWLIELKLNYDRNMDISQEAKDFIESILEKYDKKYLGQWMNFILDIYQVLK